MSFTCCFVYTTSNLESIFLCKPLTAEPIDPSKFTSFHLKTPPLTDKYLSVKSIVSGNRGILLNFIQELSNRVTIFDKSLNETLLILLTLILLTSKSPETFNPILVFHLSFLYLNVATSLISIPAPFKSDLSFA